MFVYEYVYLSVSACGGQKMVTDPPDLRFQVFVSP